MVNVTPNNISIQTAHTFFACKFRVSLSNSMCVYFVCNRTKKQCDSLKGKEEEGETTVNTINTSYKHNSSLLSVNQTIFISIKSFWFVVLFIDIIFLNRKCFQAIRYSLIFLKMLCSTISASCCTITLVMKSPIFSE